MDRKAVVVSWVDPFSHDGWCEVDQLQLEVLVIQSIGFEVYRDESVTVIALNTDYENNKVSCATVIPNECIRDYRVIDVEKED